MDSVDNNATVFNVSERVTGTERGKIMCHVLSTGEHVPGTKYGKTCDQCQTPAGRKHNACVGAKRRKICHWLEADGKRRVSQMTICSAFDWLRKSFI